MRHLLVLFLLLILKFSFSQNIKIVGSIIGDDSSFPNCVVTVNDTLFKVLNTFEPKPIDWWRNISENQRIYTESEFEGYFEIYPRLGDTLYFRADGYFVKKYTVSNLINKGSIIIELEAKECITYIECEQSYNLHAIVAQKLSVKYQENEKYCGRENIPFDSEYKAQYSILENIYGQIDKDTIEFLAYDHYSDPRFAYYDNVLIYLLEACDNFNHAKYLYHDLYKTKNGRWASPSIAKEFLRYGSKIDIKPEPIKYLDTIKYYYNKDISIDDLKELYPEPYFEIKDEYVIAMYGNYIPELFEYMKQSILKDRGYFD